LLVLNQYFWPGLEATAHLLTELCEALAARGFDVTVVTGKVPGQPTGTSRRNGVVIVRVASTTYDRRRLPLRGLNYLTYVGLALRAGLGVERPDMVLAMTDPPFVGDVAHLIARRFGVPYAVISMDVFPEIAVELGRLQNPLLVAVLRRLVRFYLERADRIIAIGETMQRRLEEKGADTARVAVIPNWVDTAALTPQPRDNRWARRKGFVDRFVVMHSGNVGYAQDLDSLVRATTLLRDLDDLIVAVIGKGARLRDLRALARRLEADNVIFLPFQERELLSQSLSSADIHVVGLARGLAGYVVPSRLYGVLAVGRPVIVAADEQSEIARVVREVGCGVVVEPGRPDLLAETIRRGHEGELDLEEMGARGREWVVAEADRGVAVDRYEQLLRSTIERTSGPSRRALVESRGRVRRRA
jgi:glycosyltransferase involved in cell wall biosynthesis